MQEIFLLFIQVLDASIRLAVPLILASIAGLFSERSGIVDIGLEGKMLAANFVARSSYFWKMLETIQYTRSLFLVWFFRWLFVCKEFFLV